MGQISSKTVLVGVAGAVGVVATAQIPAVQAAVGQLTEKGEAIAVSSSSATVSDSAKHSNVQTKAKLVNAKTETKKDAAVSTDVQTGSASVDEVTESNGDSTASAAPDTPVESAVLSDAAQSTVKPAQTVAVTIQDGDTLSAIAVQYGVTVDEIRAVNDADLDLLQIGQVVYVPSSDATATTAQTSETNSVTATNVSVDATASSVTPTPVVSAAPVASSTSVVSSVPANSVVASSTAPAISSSVVASSAPASSSAVSTPQASTPAADDNYTNAGSLTASQRSAVVNYALQLTKENIPYVWGGKTLSGFDCSGLVSYVLSHAAGVSIPAYTVSQEAYTTMSTNISSAQPGDLLFWGSKGATWHVAIYIGNNQYVAAPSEGYNVRVETISQYFMPDYVGVLN
jgi:cell wall-associated NlpC family hydrolase